MISQDLIKVLERRKKGKYRSEKSRKAVIIADMKDILRNYESEMDTDVERAMIYGINLAIYNRLTELSNEEFEEYITSICSLLEGQLSSFEGQLSSFEETISVEQSRETDPEPVIYEPVERTTKGSRRISSGMIPYREG